MEPEDIEIFTNEYIQQTENLIYAILCYAIDIAINELYYIRLLPGSAHIFEQTIELMKKDKNVNNIRCNMNGNEITILASYAKAALTEELNIYMVNSICPSIYYIFKDSIYTGYYMYDGLRKINKLAEEKNTVKNYESENKPEFFNF